jgi:hypothetical protein
MRSIVGFYRSLFQKKSLIILTLFLSIYGVKAQSYQQQRRQIFGYNIILNGLVAGVGGVINKSHEEKILNAFGRNFLKGAIGGIITYTAKFEVYQLRNPENYWIAPLDRAFYYIGNSIVYNASLNKSIFDSYRCQFYLFNIEIHLKRKFKVTPRISLLSLASLGTFFILQDHLNFKNSIKYGLFYFNENKKYIYSREGLGLNNAIEIAAHPPDTIIDFKYEVIAHEMIHTFQFPDYISISNYMKKSFQGVKSTDKYKKWSRYFYLDGPFFPILYVIYPKPNYQIFYEYEANHFSTRKFIERK